MTEIRMTLRNDRDVVAALRELEKDLPKSVMRSAMRKAMQRMQKVIIAFAPHRTFKLVNNIRVTATNKGGFPKAMVVVNQKGKRDDPQNALYWRFLELGWHARGRKGEQGAYHRHEFLANAVEVEANDAAQTVFDALGKAIDKAEAKARLRE